MDLDQDGHVDLLSGCYSRRSSDIVDMAGLFWLLKGKGEGQFDKPVAVTGEDGEPLILEAREGHDGKPQMVDKICTRPFAADLDGDGKLDIVSGNFAGDFGVFRGLGEGRFEAKNSWLMGRGGRLAVSAHSDPFLVDLDGDGDLDLVSGANSGGVWLFENLGSKTEPKFGNKQELIAPAPRTSGVVFGDDHIQGPQSSTRVWVADVNGDGKHDLLIGDAVRLQFPVEGTDEKTARAKLAEWSQRATELSKEMAAAQEADASKRQELQKAYSAHYQKRSEFLRSEATGFVWIALQR